MYLPGCSTRPEVSLPISAARTRAAELPQRLTDVDIAGTSGIGEAVTRDAHRRAFIVALTGAQRARP
jgi:hypothetical protein